VWPFTTRQASSQLRQPAEPLLRLADVSLRRGGQTVLSRVSMSIARGDIITVIGPNGAGKSSLLHLVAGLLAPSAGSLWRKPGLRLGYMPQALQLNPQLPLTVKRFLALSPSTPLQQQAIVSRLALAPFLAQPAHSLSGGEWQKVLLARALLSAPDLLVLDEPAQGVDPVGQANLYHLLGELRNELQLGILLVSHDLHIVMAKTDKVLCLNRHVCCQGAPEAVSQHPEYRRLFGPSLAEDLAVYTHHHDHNHGFHGRLVTDAAGLKKALTSGCPLVPNQGRLVRRTSLTPPRSRPQS
jgi:zinc transport system ATP-binding protein